MESKQVMTQLLADWVLNKPQSYRIHISHTDMDGYMCTAVIKFFNEHVYPVKRFPQRRGRFPNSESPIRKRDIVYKNCEVGMDNITKALDEALDEITYNSGYVPGRDVVSVLITDLSQVDVYELVSHCLDNGHVLQYLVIDHHVDTRKYGDRMNAYQTKAAYQQVYTSAWFTFPGTGACELVFNALNDVMDSGNYFSSQTNSNTSMYQVINAVNKTTTTQYRRDDVKKTYNDSIHQMVTFVDHVSKSDVGMWDEWECSFDNLGPVSAQRLLWSFYSKIPYGPERWMKDTYDAIVDGGKDLTNNILKIWRPLIRTEHQLLLEENNDFRRCVTDNPDVLFKDIDEKLVNDLLTICGAAGYKPFFINLRTDNGSVKYPNFSLVAKHNLEYGNGYDKREILIGWDPVEHSISLRSIVEDVDCSEIANRFGGGGHVKAAGFPVGPVDPEQLMN